MMPEFQIYAYAVLEALEQGKTVWQARIRHIPTNTYLGSQEEDGKTSNAWISCSLAKRNTKKQLQHRVDSWFDKQNKQLITDIEYYGHPGNSSPELYFNCDIDSLISNWYYDLHKKVIEDSLIDPYLKLLLASSKISEVPLKPREIMSGYTQKKFAPVPLSDVFTVNKYEFECDFRKLEPKISYLT